MELLRSIEDRGYPAEYLISRIRGKRTGLISDWPHLVFNGTPADYLASSHYRGFVTDRSPEGVWKDLLREYRWVYERMNNKLRAIFLQFFIYCELRTIFICLRHLEGRQGEKNSGLLLTSLLSDNIRKLLSEDLDVATAVTELERCFISLSEKFSGIAAIYEKEGLTGFEREFTERFLVVTVRGKLHPLMKLFFVHIIDARNIISLEKFIRLNLKKSPSFIPSGSMTEAAFAEIITKKDLFALYKLAGLRDDGPWPGMAEQALYKDITLLLKKAGRDPLSIGPLLEYLWRCSIEVLNLRVLFYSRDIDRESVRREIIF